MVHSVYYMPTIIILATQTQAHVNVSLTFVEFLKKIVEGWVDVINHIHIFLIIGICFIYNYCMLSALWVILASAFLQLW